MKSPKLEFWDLGSPNLLRHPRRNVGAYLAQPRLDTALRRSADVAKYTLHDLRRPAITSWAGQLPIQVVQELARRSDIATTRKYQLTVRSEDMISANQVLDSILVEARDD